MANVELDKSPFLCAVFVLDWHTKKPIHILISMNQCAQYIHQIHVVFVVKDLSSSKSLTKFRWIDNNIQIMERKFLKFYQIQSLSIDAG